MSPTGPLRIIPGGTACDLRPDAYSHQVTAKTLAQHDELMKKTETMSILMETNKMLREERDKLEQELHQTQAKVSAASHLMT